MSKMKRDKYYILSSSKLFRTYFLKLIFDCLLVYVYIIIHKPFTGKELSSYLLVILTTTL